MIQFLVATSRCTKFNDSKYLIPEAICAPIYKRQLKLSDLTPYGTAVLFSAATWVLKN